MAIGAGVAKYGRYLRIGHRTALDLYVAAHGMFWAICTTWVSVYGSSATIDFLVPDARYKGSLALFVLSYLMLAGFAVMIHIAWQGGVASLSTLVAYDVVLVASLLTGTKVLIPRFELAFGIALFLLPFYLLLWFCLKGSHLPPSPHTMSPHAGLLAFFVDRANAVTRKPPPTIALTVASGRTWALDHALLLSRHRLLLSPSFPRRLGRVCTTFIGRALHRVGVLPFDEIVPHRISTACRFLRCPPPFVAFVASASSVGSL